MNKTQIDIVTGPLGSGKTTLLNHLLTDESHGMRLAVIVDDAAQTGIDSRLLARTEQLTVLKTINGCVCCESQGDFLKALASLSEQSTRFDRIVLETSGLSDPGPIVQSLLRKSQVSKLYGSLTVVTLVDVKNFHKHLTQEEARNQILFADLIVLNKCDMVYDDEQQILEVEQAVKQINGLARICRTNHSKLAANMIFGLRIAVHDPDHNHSCCGEGCHHEDHHHDDCNHDHGTRHAGTKSFDLVLQGDLDFQKFNSWYGRLVRTEGEDNLIRTKGILAVKGEENPVVVHSVFDDNFRGNEQLGWNGSGRHTTMHFFWRNILDTELLRQGLKNCLVGV